MEFLLFLNSYFVSRNTFQMARCVGTMLFHANRALRSLRLLPPSDDKTLKFWQVYFLRMFCQRTSKACGFIKI